MRDWRSRWSCQRSRRRGLRSTYTLARTVDVLKQGVGDDSSWQRWKMMMSLVEGKGESGIWCRVLEAVFGLVGEELGRDQRGGMSRIGDANLHDLRAGRMRQLVDFVDE